MGVISDYYDREVSKAAYMLAVAISREEIDYFELGAQEVTKEEICDYLKQHHDPFFRGSADLIAGEAYHRLQQFLGRANPDHFFLLSAWHFKKKKNVPEKIIKICIKYDLGWGWRFSTDNDFFIFRPEKHGIGLEIINTPNYTPDRLNEIFWGIETDSGPMRFGW